MYTFRMNQMVRDAATEKCVTARDVIVDDDVT